VQPPKGAAALSSGKFHDDNQNKRRLPLENAATKQQSEGDENTRTHTRGENRTSFKQAVNLDARKLLFCF